MALPLLNLNLDAIMIRFDLAGNQPILNNSDSDSESNSEYDSDSEVPRNWIPRYFRRYAGVIGT